MSINIKNQKTTVINLGEYDILINDVKKTQEFKETTILDLSNKSMLKIGEIRYLRDSFENKKLFTKIIKNAEGSIFLDGTLTIQEKIFNDARDLTIKQVAYFAVYYKNQLGQSDSFSRIVKNTNALFENWFHTYVKYNFLVKLDNFYITTISALTTLGDKDATIYETDIELGRKEVIRFIERNFLKDFKSFLFSDWEKSLKKNEDFLTDSLKKKQTILFDI